MPFDLDTAKPVSGGFDLSTAKPVNQQAPQSFGDDVASIAKNAVGAVVEPALQMASAAVAAPVAGLVGMGNAMLPGHTAADAAKAVQDTQKTLTYEPQTEGGQAVSGVIAKPFEWVAGKAKDAGQFTMDKTGNATLSAGVETAVNALPALLAKGAVKGARAVRGAVAASGEAKTLAAAQQATQQAGLDWSKLPGQVRAQIMQVARDAAKKDPSGQALERETRMASHPVPITPTAGQATRNPVQLKLEKQISQTDSGAPVRERFVEQNRQLQQNLDTIRGRTGARVQEGLPEASGEVVQRAARAKLDEQKTSVRRLYQKAESAGEMETRVDVQPLVDHYLKSVDPKQLQYAMDYLKQINVLKVEADGEYHIRRPATLKEVERLRQHVSTVARTDKSTPGAMAGQFVHEIDSLMDKTQSGPLYKEARAARRALGDEFERQSGVKGLVNQKSGMSDRSVALEDTFKKTVLGGSIQDLRNSVRTLNEGQKGTRKVGRQAIKELAGQTVDYLKSEATKSVASMETGEATFNANGFVKAVDRIGRPKLETMLGKTATDELYKLQQTAKDLLTEPPTREAGSSTFSNFLRWIDKHGSRIPIVGSIPSELATKVQARQALKTPYRLSDRTAEIDRLRAKVNPDAGANTP